MNQPPSTLAAFGLCNRCQNIHSLPVGNSRVHAIKLMQQLDERQCIDDGSNPKLSTDYLWGEARGQMFGVLECEDADGNPVVLKAFSCQYNGEWVVDGWVPPIPDPQALEQLIAQPDREINCHTRALQELSPADPNYSARMEARKQLSQQLMRQIHALYRITNFRGETCALSTFFPTGGIATGVGDCCAPKLLQYAARAGLRPIGLSEFFYGKSNPSATRQHGHFYPACAEKCRPILGFMLCGLEVADASRERPPLHIVYADDDIVVVNKPSGLLSVPGKGPENQDCVTVRIQEIFPDCPPHPEVHRLDMDTSGLLVLARNRDAQRELSRQFHDRETSKKYIALLEGTLDRTEGVIQLAFRLDVDHRPRQIYDPIHGKLGITRWKSVGAEAGKTRVEFQPITGRTHQLRVHAASEHGLATPIVGDRLYGTGTAPGQLQLHACELCFKHPASGRKMRFASAPAF